MKFPKYFLERFFHKISKLFFTFFGLYLFRSKDFNGIYPLPKFFQLWSYLNTDQQSKILPFLNLTCSQNSQDLLAIAMTQKNKTGYFVEFGACDGILYSNTLLLEKYLGWHGIVAEPGRIWHKDLKKNRSCIVETRCIFESSNQRIKFDEVQKVSQQIAPQISGISDVGSGDWTAKFRKLNSISYEVETISLVDLLNEYSAPSIIDFISIDTEGSEFEILKNFDFEKYRFNLLVVEHNYGKNREKIFQLMTSNGYERFLSEISGVDDFYVRRANP